MIPVQQAVRAMRVLVADPEAAARKTLRERLRADGYRYVEVVEDGAETIGRLGAGQTGNRPFDLVCLALRLPDRGGLETLDEIHALFDLPVVMLAEAEDRVAAVEALARGAADYVVRPFDFSLLLFKIEKLLIERFLKRELNRSNVRNETLFLNVLAVMAKVLEAKDPNTRAHSEKVSRLAAGMGRQAGLSEDEIRSLGVAGILHDLGKMGIREAVLMKPGPLNDEERQLVERHPLIAGTLLEPIERLRGALSAIRHHHEHFDGSGYPDGLRGDEIPFDAQVLHVAEAFDVMVSVKTYAPTKTQKEAVAELHEKAGEQFAPDAVRLIIPILEGGLRILRRPLSGDSIRTMISNLSEDDKRRD